MASVSNISVGASYAGNMAMFPAYDAPTDIFDTLAMLFFPFCY